MSYTCKIEERPVQPALVIKAQVAVQDLPQTLGRLYGAIEQYLAELGFPPAGAPYVAYFNMDMENLEIEAGFPVAQELPGKGEIQPAAIPGGQAAVCDYTGPYQELGPAYEALTRLVQEQGREPTGVSYEFYLNDPTVTAPEALQTRIVFPLR